MNKRAEKLVIHFGSLILIGFFVLTVFGAAVGAQCEKKKTRDFINQGNQLFNQNNFSAALERYDRALKNEPQCSLAFFNRGQTLRKLNRLDDAINAFDRALTLNYPDKTALHLALAASFLAKGTNWTNDVLKNAQAAINVNRQAVEGWVLLAAAYQTLGQTENEIKALAEVVRLAPNNAEARRTKGAAHYRARQYRESLAEFKKLTELEPNNPTNFLTVSDLHRIVGENQLAVIAAQNALKIKPDYSEAYFTLGNGYLSLKQFDSAARSFQQAINFKTEHVAESFYNLGLAKMALADYDDATAAFQQALNQQVKLFAPETFKSFVYKSLGRAYGQLGNYREAIRYLEQAKEINADDVIADVDLSWWHSLLGNNEMAVAAAARAISKAPSQPMGYVNRCRAYLTLRKLNEALADCEKALQFNSDDGETLFYYGRVLRDKNRKREADAANKKAIAALEKELGVGKTEDREIVTTFVFRRRPVAATAMPAATDTDDDKLLSVRVSAPYTPYILGNAYFDDNQLSKAVNYYQLALRRAPRFPLARLNLGIVYVNLKDKSAALTQYHELLKIDPKRAEDLKKIIGN